MSDERTVQKLQHFSRERGPERVVHAKGSAAHGFFESDRGRLPVHQGRPSSSPASRTPLFLRFSTVAGEQGSRRHRARPARLRAQALHRGGQLRPGRQQHPGLLHPRRRPSSATSSTRRSASPTPACAPTTCSGTSGRSRPSSAHQVTMLMSGRGTPRTLRHMNGYGSHTFSWVNAGGEKFWVKYHFKTDQGIENSARPRRCGRRPRTPTPTAATCARRSTRAKRLEWRLRGAGHAVRGRRRLPLQPVRPDQGLAARRLPADRGRPPRPRPQPRELRRRGRAGGLLARQPGARASASARTRC